MAIECTECPQHAAICCPDCGKDYYLRDVEAQAEIGRLTAENDQLRHDYNIASELVSLKEERSYKAEAERDAIAAAANEAAADFIEETACCARGDFSARIRSKTPADARATLDRMLRQAKAEGMKEAAEMSKHGHYPRAILARAAEIDPK